MIRPPCSRYRLTVNDQPVPVHQTPDAAVALFEFVGADPAHVVVELLAPLPPGEPVLRPLRKAPALTREGSRLVFSLTSPAPLTLELGDDLAYPLILLPWSATANASPSPAADARPALRFGPGHHDAGLIEVADGSDIIFEAGAWVTGRIHLCGRRGVRIYGPGALDAVTAPETKSPTPVLLEDCEDILIEGPLALAHANWHYIVRRCRDVVIRRAHAVGSAPCSDGIDVDGSSRVRVEDCFIKTNDDCLVIKSTPRARGARVEDVSFTGCTLWNGPAGNGIDIGYETHTDLIRDIVFRDLDIVHVQCHHESGWVDRIAGLAIHITGDARVENVRFEDITMEDVRTPKLFQFMVFHYHRDHGWFSPADRLARGHLSGLLLKNIRVLRAAAARVHIEGFNTGHDIENVIFDNVTLEGIPLRDRPDLVLEVVNTTGFEMR